MLCQILEPTEDSIQLCSEYLLAGEVIGVPTETVYGLAGNALCKSTVQKIFEVKGRPFIDPLIVHFKSTHEAKLYAHFNDTAIELAEQFWPGALTLVLPKKSIIPDIVTAHLTSVAVRVPGHPIFHELLKRIDFPLAAPSANPFGYVSPTNAFHVQTTLGDHIPAVLDAGSCEHGIESTIIDLRNPNEPEILRPGPISMETLCLPTKRECNLQSDYKAQIAPGMLKRHYSPKATLTLFPHGASAKDPELGDCIVYNKRPNKLLIDGHTYWLSENGDRKEIAHNLFMILRKLDLAGYAQIHMERVQDIDVGIAINDRLLRAAESMDKPGENG